jgi:hypothetical protein
VLYSLSRREAGAAQPARTEKFEYLCIPVNYYSYYGVPKEVTIDEQA